MFKDRISPLPLNAGAGLPSDTAAACSCHASTNYTLSMNGFMQPQTILTMFTIEKNEKLNNNKKTSILLRCHSKKPYLFLLF